MSSRPCYPRCRHCGRERCHRRGLCRRCYSRPDIRARYNGRPISPRARQGEQAEGGGDVCGNRPWPEEPTQEEPGSEAKILVLSGRAARREQLHHPEDRRLCDLPAETPSPAGHFPWRPGCADERVLSMLRVLLDLDG